MENELATITIVSSSLTRLEASCNDEEFASLVQRSVTSDTWVFLRSGGDAEQGRYSIAGWAPLLLLEAKGREALLWRGQQAVRLLSDVSPIDVLDNLFDSVHHDLQDHGLPFSTGLLGYSSYDIKHDIERLPLTATDDLNLPDLLFFLPASVLVHDRQNGEVYNVEITAEIQVQERTELETLPAWSHCRVRTQKHDALSGPSAMLKKDYLHAVERIRDYIRDGDVYQVNYAQRFEYTAPAVPYEFWRQLFRQNPAPYYAYIATPSHTVLCTSMERCLRLDGGVLRSQPIKGTRKRGQNKADDAALKHELLNDPKESAELSMIVDLVRNDLGRISSTGTVQVKDHKRLDSYSNVHHLSSEIDGQIRDGVSLRDILRAILPAGSITGCPKIRAMEIIDELEPYVRHVYTGAIGYIGFHHNIDLNVAIRTALCTNDRMYFSVGGAIVYDSIPENEYEETLHKGETLFSLILKDSN
jgi:para-aminobenzoate synthetase component I